VTTVKRRALIQSISAAAIVPVSAWVSVWAGMRREAGDAGPVGTAVYELRVYHAAAGKLAELLARFRDHTVKIFERHGMKSVAYWTPTDEPQKSATLIYILEHPSRESATANWKAFQDDAEWKSVREKSEENGKLVEKVDSTFMELTDFSSRLK
jgi:NIPSNAP